MAIMREELYAFIPMDDDIKTRYDSFWALQPMDRDQFDALNLMLRNQLDPEFDCQSMQVLPADTGWGKSRVGLHWLWIMHNVFGKRPMLILPPNLRTQWKALLKLAEIDEYDLYSYNQIRGTIGKAREVMDPLTGEVLTERDEAKIKHPYLMRDNGPTGPFYGTEHWLETCRDPGVCMLFDESQNMKNKTSAQHWAAFELIRWAMYADGAECYGIHLSASMIDKKENWAPLYRICGLINERVLYQQNPATGMLEYQQHGVGCALNHARQIDEEVVELILDDYDVSAKNLPFILNNLWTEVFRDHLVVPVTDPIYCDPETGEPYKRERNNLFIELCEEGMEMTAAGIQMLRRAHILDDNGRVDVAAANRSFAVVQKALMMMCSGKVPDTARKAMEILTEERTDGKTPKVVIAASFKEDQQRLYRELQFFGCQILNGDVPAGQARQDMMDLLNQPDNECQVLIITGQVGGTGCSLHDTDGDFPRTIFVLPSFHFVNDFQCTGRTYRRGMRSDVTVNMIYGKNAGLESLVINALMKSRVGLDVMQEGSGRVYPGQFEIIIENEDENDQPLRQQLEASRAEMEMD
jgi:hypothetical protein